MQISCVISRRQGWIHCTVFPLWRENPFERGSLMEPCFFNLYYLQSFITTSCLNGWTKSSIACVHLCVVRTSACVCVCQSGNLDVHAWPVTERFPHGSRNWYAAHIVCVRVSVRERKEKEKPIESCVACMQLVWRWSKRMRGKKISY